VLMINFYIWECKLRKTRLSLASLMLDYTLNVKKSLKISRKMRHSCLRLNVPFFRQLVEDIGVRDGGGEEQENEP
jgi:hypothetical protein